MPHFGIPVFSNRERFSIDPSGQGAHRAWVPPNPNDDFRSTLFATGAVRSAEDPVSQSPCRHSGSTSGETLERAENKTGIWILSSAPFVGCKILSANDLDARGRECRHEQSRRSERAWSGRVLFKEFLTDGRCVGGQSGTIVEKSISAACLLGVSYKVVAHGHQSERNPLPAAVILL